MATRCAVGQGARLDVWMEPTISVAGSRHHTTTTTIVRLDGGSARVCVEADRAASWLPVASDAAVVMAIGHDRPDAMSLLAALVPEGERSCLQMKRAAFE